MEPDVDTDLMVRLSLCTNTDIDSMMRLASGDILSAPANFNYQNIVLTMIGISNSNKTRYQVGRQSRTNACI